MTRQLKSGDAPPDEAPQKLLQLGLPEETGEDEAWNKAAAAAGPEPVFEVLRSSVGRQGR